MRLGTKEVNVRPGDRVPHHGWVGRLYLWACERLYDELAWHYDVVSWLVSAGAWRRWQMGVWREVQGHQVLEIGCGTGAMLVEGQRRGVSVVGVDRSPRMLAVARQRLACAGCNSALLLSDGRALPLDDGAFDTVFATFPAGYILERETLHEAHRVLRRNGRLVILGLWVELRLGALERFVPVFYGRPSAASLESVVQRLASAGFCARWLEQRHSIFTVGLLVAERS